jgi:hypothetical protein
VVDENELDRRAREVIEELRPKAESLHQEKFLLRGVALGLFYGIIGNMLVSHYYEVFRGIVIWQFDTLFWTNLVVFISILVAIILVSWRWLLSMAKIEGFIEAFERLKKQYHVGI